MLITILSAVLFLSPATAPTSQSSVESDLRRIIAGLQQQISSLKTENADLRRKLAQASATTKPAKPAEKKIGNGKPTKIEKGMTKDEVSKIYGQSRHTSTDASGRERVEWERHELRGGPTDLHDVCSERITAEIENGVVVDFQIDDQ